ncbi:MAG: Ig-like domain-containing protein [Gallionellaceae bacterium]
MVISTKHTASYALSVLALSSMLALSGCGQVASTTATTTAVTPTASTLLLSASPLNVQSDNSTPATISLSSISASNTAVAGVVVTLASDTGLLDKSTITTDGSGVGTFTFKAGGVDRSNRTATITATAGTVTAQLPVQIVGSTAAITSSSGSLSDNGTQTSTMTVTAKDSASTVMPNTSVVLTQSGAGIVAFSPASGVTNASGVFTSTVSGTTAGNSTVTASTLGATASSAFTITPSAATLSILSSTLNGGTATSNPIQVAMKIGDTLAIKVNAPGATQTQVRFVTTIGSWSPVGAAPLPATATVVTVVGGTATATLSTTQAGVASVYVDDPASTGSNASMSVSMTATTAATVTLQASPSLVSKSVGTTKGVSTLIATVNDANGMPVGGAPIAFTIVNPTGGGETVTPAFSLSATTTTTALGLGQASTSFTSGSKSSGQTGVQIRAQVLGTAVLTGTSPSGIDASVVIGGSAGSIAFGSATVLTETANLTSYIQAMSVLVADSNGNPAPAGTVVNLSAWPIAWSTGTLCAVSATYYNEDVNENLFLDTGEDGVRRDYATGVTGTAGTLDSLITPVNSAAGTVPGSVTTDASGLATFNLTYGKNSAFWVITRIRARTVVQGSEALSEWSFRLPALKADYTPCILPNSPYTF